MTVGGTPPAEVAIDASLVRDLLADQMPDLAQLGDPVLLAEGWDYMVFRLGPSLTVRLPRRALSAEFAANELRWLPELAPHLSLPVPAAVRVGRPALEYPWSWSVCPWLPGDIAARCPPADSVDAARTLAAFLRSLHVPAPGDAPRNPFRDHLAGRDAGTSDRLARAGPAARGLGELWDRALAVPEWSGPPVWVHGDLHPANVLVDDGRVSGVIDFVDLSAGDPAPDLAVAWLLFDDQARGAFRDALGDIDEPTWARGRGWAVFYCAVFLDHALDDPLYRSIGEAAVERLLATD